MLNCVISNIPYTEFEIFLDDKRITNYKHINSEITFNISIDSGSHVLKLIFKKAKRKFPPNTTTIQKLLRINQQEFADFNCSLEFRAKNEAVLNLCLSQNEACVRDKALYYFVVDYKASKNISITNKKYNFTALKRKGYFLILRKYFLMLLLSIAATICFGYEAFFTGDISFANRFILGFPIMVFGMFTAFILFFIALVDWKSTFIKVISEYNKNE